MRAHLFFAVPLLMLAACSQEPAEEDNPFGEESAAPQTPLELDLEATGIIIPPQNGFEELAAPFGSPRQPTELTLGNVLGDVIERGEEPNECGLTFTRYQGVTVNFRGDEFVGYWAESPFVPELDRATMLEDPAIALVEDSTLDGEFTITANGESISGIFAGESADATVRALWAGENCIAR